MSAASEMVAGACPLCSFLRAEHRELCEDVLVFPRVTQSAAQSDWRYRNGTYRITGCPHMRPVFGPHATLAEAEAALAAHLAGLRRQKAQARAEIEAACALREVAA